MVKGLLSYYYNCFGRWEIEGLGAGGVFFLNVLLALIDGMYESSHFHVLLW